MWCLGVADFQALILLPKTVVGQYCSDILISGRAIFLTMLMMLSYASLGQCYSGILAKGWQASKTGILMPGAVVGRY